MKINFNLTLISIVGLLLVLISLPLGYRLLFSQNIKRKEIISLATNLDKADHHTINALGYIQPKNRIIKLAGPSQFFNGRIVDLKIKEGDVVQKGQIIATLDNLETQQAALNTAKLNVKVHSEQINQLLAGEAKKGEIKAQQALIASLKAQFIGDVAIQKSRIARFQAEFFREEEANNAKINRLQAELNHAQIECSRYQTLHKDGAVNTSTLDTICLVVKTTEEMIKEAQANKNKTLETLKKEQQEAKDTLNKTLSTFPQQISQAQATLVKLQEVRSVDLKVAQAEREQALAQVSQAKAESDLAVVRSPVRGEILKIHTFAGEKINAEGIVDLVQIDEMYVIAEVYETDIKKIHINNTATIQSRALNKNLTGKVVQISKEIGKKNIFNTDPTLNIDARVFAVKIKLEPSSTPEAANFINLEVDVKINTNS